MNPMTPGQPEPGAAMDPEAGEPDDGGYEICIAVAADGSLSVGLDDGAMKPAADIKDALTQALAIYKNDGQATQDESDAQFSQGFASRGMAGG